MLLVPPAWFVTATLFGLSGLLCRAEYCRFHGPQSCTGTTHSFRRPGYRAPVDNGTSAAYMDMPLDNAGVAKIWDVDKDGWPDIGFLLENEPKGQKRASLMWMRNLGFNASSGVPMFGPPELALNLDTKACGMAAGDLNGDGFDDVVFNMDMDYFQVYWGQKNASFVEGPVIGNWTSPPLGDILLRDMDDDGLLDLLRPVLCKMWSGCLNLLWHRNIGNASHPIFSNEGDDMPFQQINLPYLYFLEDTDNDGDLDLGFIHGSALYYENTGTTKQPLFQPRPPTCIPPDVEADRKTLQWTRMPSNGVRLFLFAFNTWNVRIFESTPIYSPLPLATRFEKLDGDANPLNGVNLTSLVGTGPGRVQVKGVGGDSLSRIVFVDGDGDGLVDIIGTAGLYLANTADPKVPQRPVFEPRPLNRSTAPLADLVSTLLQNGSAVCFGDITGDGAADLIHLTTDSQLIMYRRLSATDTRTRSFVTGFGLPERLMDLPEHVTQVLVGDYDGDGYADVIYVIDGDRFLRQNLGWRPDGQVRWGEWTYNAPPQDHSPYEVDGYDLADLDGDGRAELVYTWTDRGSRRWGVEMENAQDVFIGTTTGDTGEVYTRSVHVVDLNADGPLDVVVLTSDGLAMVFQQGPCYVTSGICSNRGGCFTSAMYGTCQCQGGYTGPRCELCSPGYAWNDTACARCSDLGWGGYSNSTNGQCMCLPSFMRASGAPAGMPTGQGPCMCPPGTGFDAYLTRCTPCGVGSFTDIFTLGQCSPCMSSKVTGAVGAKAAEECACPLGTYESLEGDCRPCTEGMSCSGQGVVLKKLSLKAGYWRACRTSDDIRKCPQESNCQGKDDPDRQCSDGSNGPLCAVCSRRHAKTWTGKCTDCSEHHLWKTVWLPLCLIVAIVLVIYCLYRNLHFNGLRLTQQLKIIVTVYQVK